MRTKARTENTALKAKGKLRERIGRARGKKSMVAKGKGDQLKSGLRQAGERIKDAAAKH